MVREAASRSIHPRWWTLDGDTLADEVCAIADGLEADHKPRLNRFLLFTSLYEVKPLKGLHAAAYDTTDSYYEDLYVPICRSLCDTVQADIAGRQRPKPQFMTSGADWRTRRRARRLGQFVEGVLHQPQGVYVDGWELTTDAFLDAAVCGIGTVKVYVDQDGKVVLERLKPGRIKVDAREADNGMPSNYFDGYLMDEDEAVARFVDDEDLDIDEQEREDRRGAIERACLTDQAITVDSYGLTRIARSVKIREAWREPISKKSPGKHAICVPGKVLFVEDWDRPAPLVFFRWARERIGFWGTGLVEEAKSIVSEYNRAIERMQARMVLCANKRTYYKEGSVKTEDLEGNEDESFVAYTGDQPPIETLTPPITPQEVEYSQMIRQLCYESTGVSMMSSTSRKEQDVTAGVAIRTLIDMAAKRFAIKARYGYEYPFVSLAKQIVMACADFTEKYGGDIQVPVPGKGFVSDVKWSQAKLDLDGLIVNVEPVSALATDFPGRLQTVQEMFSAGLISPEAFTRLSDWPDLQREMERNNAEWEYLETVIARYLDAEKPEEAEYEPPDGYIVNKPGALIQFGQAYFQAKRERAPEFNLQLLRQYMLQLSETIQRANMPANNQGAPLGAGPPAPSPGMAPSGAPLSPVGPAPVPGMAA